ncbi:MAG: redoxin domain-containing protein [Chloroflexota bacterium]
MKFNKKTLLLIILGGLVIIAVSLTLFRYQRIDEKNQLNNKIALAETRLKNIQPDELSSRIKELESKLAQTEEQYKDAQAISPGQITSVSATNQLFEIARGYGLEVTNLDVSGSSNGNLEGINFSIMSLKAKIKGTAPDILNFVSNLNSQFRRCVVKSIAINMGTGAADVAQTAPAFELPDLDGQITSLSKLKGEPVLLYFWQVWRPDSRDGISYLQQIYDKWGSKGLIVRAIDVGESPLQINEFLLTKKLTLPVLLDTNGNVAQKYNVANFPVTVLIDGNGMIQQTIVGALSSKETIEGYLGKILPGSEMTENIATAELELSIYNSY